MVDSAGVALGCVQCIGTETNGNASGVADSRCDIAGTSVEACNASNQWAAPDACEVGDFCMASGGSAWCYTPAAL